MEGRKKYRCEICSSEFSWRKNLTRHKEAKHKGVVRFACQKCNKTFYRKDEYKQHEKTCKGMSMKRASDEQQAGPSTRRQRREDSAPQPSTSRDDDENLQLTSDHPMWGEYDKNRRDIEKPRDAAALEDGTLEDKINYIFNYPVHPLSKGIKIEKFRQHLTKIYEGMRRNGGNQAFKVNIGFGSMLRHIQEDDDDDAGRPKYRYWKPVEGADFLDSLYKRCKTSDRHKTKGGKRDVVDPHNNHDIYRCYYANTGNRV